MRLKQFALAAGVLLVSASTAAAAIVTNPLNLRRGPGTGFGVITTMPPGARAKAHKHVHHETAIYVLSGEAAMYYGERLAQHMVVRAGDFVYIPADMPHLPYNMSQTEPCMAVIARTDPNEQESVKLLPELDGKVPV